MTFLRAKEGTRFSKYVILRAKESTRFSKKMVEGREGTRVPTLSRWEGTRVMDFENFENPKF